MAYLMNLEGSKYIIVGASSGIGRQTAITLSLLGASVVLIARREEKLREVLRELEGLGHSYYRADMSELDNIAGVFQQISDEQGPVDGLVYCAGVNSTLPIAQLKPEKLLNAFQINFFAFVESVRQISRRGRFNKGMRIVAVSSNAAIRGDKAHTAYSASKAAMNAAIRCMAKELVGKSICINAVAPAMTNTELFQQYANISGGLSEGEKQLLERQYMGLIEPEDVANAIAFMLSPAARMITGITLPVDGGLSTN